MQDNNATQVRIADDVERSSEVLREDVCFTKKLEDTMIENSKQFKGIQWQYFGSTSGMMRMWPFTPWPIGDDRDRCAAFDPRVRPWYVGASSGPKNVILVIDRSGSHDNLSQQGRLRMDVSRLAAKDVLDTLTNSDFVNVVSFTDQADVFSDQLQRANEDVIRQAKSWIDQVETGESASFPVGLQRAKEILEDSTTKSPCITTVLFLTDGDAVNDESEVLGAVDDLIADNSTVLFTFTIGESHKDLPKKMACRGGGVWTNIEGGFNVRGQMSQYYLFLAGGIERDEVTWTEPFEDANLGTEVVTAAMPVYDTNSTPPVLLGVVGVDVPLADFPEVGSDFLEFLRQRSEACVNFNPTPCQLQFLRRNPGGASTSTESNDDAVCDDGPALADCDSGDEEVDRAVCDEPIQAESVTCGGDLLREGNWEEFGCCDSSGLSVLYIALIAVGGALVVAVAAYFCYFRGRNAKTEKHASKKSSSSNNQAAEEKEQQPQQQPQPNRQNDPSAGYPPQPTGYGGYPGGMPGGPAYGRPPIPAHGTGGYQPSVPYPHQPTGYGGGYPGGMPAQGRPPAVPSPYGQQHKPNPYGHPQQQHQGQFTGANPMHARGGGTSL